jgi:chromosome segregation ATPase
MEVGRYRTSQHCEKVKYVKLHCEPRPPAKMKRFSTEVAPQPSRKRRHLDSSIEAELSLQAARQEVADLTNTLREQEARIRRLEADRAFLNDRDDARKQDYVDDRLEEWTAAKRALEHKVAALETAQDALTSDKNDLEATNRRLEHELMLSQEKIAALEQFPPDVKLERKPDVSMPDLPVSTPSRPTRREDNDVIHQELTRQVKHIKRMEAQMATLSKENEAFKLKHEAISLLKEQNRALTVQLTSLSSTRRELAEAQETIKSLEAEKMRWATFLSEEDTFETPQNVTKELMRLRLELNSAKERLESRKSALESRDAIVADLEARQEEIEGELTAQKEKRLKAEEKARATDRQVRLLKQERDFLKEQLVSFATYIAGRLSWLCAGHVCNRGASHVSFDL